MKWIEVKMRQLGVTSNPNYKITFMMDSMCMICLHTQEYGFLDVSILGTFAVVLMINMFPSYSTGKTIGSDLGQVSRVLFSKKHNYV